jgi:hypothetical protein
MAASVLVGVGAICLLSSAGPFERGPLPAAIPFAHGMIMPELRSHPVLAFSKAAIAFRAKGFATGRCTIEIDGSVTECRIETSFPDMNAQVLDYLRGLRYSSCVRVEGRCRRVSVQISVHVDPPAPAAPEAAILSTRR